MSKHSIETSAVDEARRQIQNLVRQIRGLSEQDLEPQQYFAEFLPLIVRGLGGIGGAIWVADAGGRISPLCPMNLSNALLDPESEQGQRHLRLVRHLFTGKEPQLAQPNSTTGDDGTAGNPTDFLLVLAPIVVKSEAYAVVEVFQRTGADANTQRGYLRFLQQMCSLATEWVQSRQLRQLNSQVSLLSRYDQFISNVYAGLNSKQTAYAIANEAHGLVDCDRVSVGIQHGRKCKIEAVSGQDTFDRRSNIVALLGKLVTRVVATAEPLWYTGPTDALPRQIEDAIVQYVEESHSKSIFVLPIFQPQQQVRRPGDDTESDDADGQSREAHDVIGAPVVEKIEDVLSRDVAMPQLEMIQDHAGRALGNSLKHSNLPFLSVMRATGAVTGLFRGKTRRKTLAVLAVVLVVLLCLSFIPIDFEMEGRGTLQPVKKHDLFAPVEGKVTRLRVTSGQDVVEGQVLIELENPDLDLQIEENRGKIDATEKRITSLNYQVLHAVELTKDERLDLFTDLNVRETELKNLKRQESILKRKQAGLTITSPINGRVATWNVEELLSGRPVSPHQVLLTVFDPHGDWELELNMPEKRMGHINDALAKLDEGEKLQVQYVLASEPGVTRVGTVEEVQPQTRLHEEEGHSVLFRVAIDVDDPEDPIDDAHLGLLAIGQVKVGRRPIAYVHLHQAWEWLQVNFFFKFF